MYGHTNPTIRTTNQGETVGPKMHACIKLASWNDYPSKNALAKDVGPNGSQDYGYRIVNRCIQKGLLSQPDPTHPDATPNGLGAVTISEKGRKYLEAHE